MKVDNDTIKKIFVKLELLDDLSKDVKELREDMKILRADVDTIRSRVTLTELRFSSLEDNMKVIRTELKDLRIYQKKTNATIDHMAKSLAPYLEMVAASQEQLKDHHVRISFLEKRTT